MKELIPEGGQFYKVNMHSHTDISDGRQTPQQIKETFKALGYSAVCFTDHEVLIGHQDLADEDFIPLHGYEVCIKRDQSIHTAWFQPVYHFNFIAKEPDNLRMPMFYEFNRSWPGNSESWARKEGVFTDTIDTTHYSIPWINDYLAEVEKSGYLINYNHPEWSLQGPADYLGLEHVHSIELINSGCLDLNDNTAFHYQALLRQGRHMVPTAGDDNHRQAGCGFGWTMLKAPELSYQALIKAYEQGHCYASEGPEILSLVLDGDKIRIRTSPARSITLLSQGRYVQQVKDDTCQLTEAEFDYCPQKMGTFFRLEVRDEKGNKAFSNAYWTKDLA